jgi:hypothetical protein
MDKDELRSQAISPREAQRVGLYTEPKTYGVYAVPKGRRFRHGNHWVREEELVRECGNAVLVALFRTSESAQEVARHLNNVVNDFILDD